MIEQRFQVFKIEQQQTFAIGDLERRIQRRLLTVGEFQQAADQQWAHFAQRGTQRMPGFAMNIPQGHRIRLRCVVKPRHAGDAFGDLALWIAGGAEAAQITLDVGGEHRDTGVAERFGQALQGDRLAGAGGAGDQAVAVRQAHRLGSLLAGRIGADYELRGVRHFVTQWLIFDAAWPIKRLRDPTRVSRTFP